MNLTTFIADLPSMTLAVAGKGALISLAALGSVLALRRAAAASRHLVLTLAVVALLGLPALVAVLPAWRLEVLPGAEPLEPSGFPGHSSGVLLPLLPLLVSMLLLIRLLVGGLRLFGLKAGSRSAPVEWQELLEMHRRRLGVARPVRLAVSPAVAVPVTFGFWRPVVLLPEAARGWAGEPLSEALIHELSHVRRGDWHIQMLARAACALYWANPLVWWICRRLLLEAELACDDQVLRSGVSAEGYAERLVALARQVRAMARRPASAVAFVRPPGLASRVSAILDSGRRRGRPGRSAVAGAGAAALSLLLLVAPARLARAEPGAPRPVEQGVFGALQGEDSVRDGVREGIPEGLREGIRDGLEEGVRAGVEEARQDPNAQGVKD